MHRTCRNSSSSCVGVEGLKSGEKRGPGDQTIATESVMSIKLTITKDEATKKLTELLKSRDELITSLRRKKWRPSEIAMSVLDVEREKEALRMALTALGSD